MGKAAIPGSCKAAVALPRPLYALVLFFDRANATVA